MRKVIHNYLYTFSYQIFLMILPVLTMPYISRVLLPKGVGINSWTYSISYYFVLLAVLGLTTYGQREIALCSDDQSKLNRTFWEIEAASIITTILSLFLYTITILIVGRYKEYMLIYGISILASLLDISWLFSGLEKFSILSFRNFIIKTASVVLMFLLVKSSNDLGIYILIQSCTVLISNLSLWPKAISIVGWASSISLTGVLGRIKHSFSYFIPQISISLYVTLNKVILGFLSGTVATGYFDSSDKIVRLLFSAFTALSTVMLPRVSSMFAQKKFDDINRIVHLVLKLSVWIIIPLSFGVFVNARLITLVLLGDKYLKMIPVLKLTVLIMIPMSVANVFGSQVLIPFNRIKAYTISVLGGALINLLVDVPLVLFANAEGASIASLISESTVMALQIYYCRDILSVSAIFRGLFFVCPEVVLLIIGAFGISLLPQSHMLVILIISLILAVIYIMLTFRNVLTQIEKLQLTPSKKR